MKYICQAQRPKTLTERKNRPQRVLTFQNQPQREIRVVALSKSTKTRSGILKKATKRFSCYGSFDKCPQRVLEI